MLNLLWGKLFSCQNFIYGSRAYRTPISYMPRSWRSAPFTMISQLDPAFFHKVLDAPETQLRVILAEDRGQVIGLMTYYPMFHLHSATSGLNLHHLFIDERYRGQGCAQQFMEYLTNAAAEFGASYITVSADLKNEPAHPLYLSMGFKRVAMGGAFFEYRSATND